MGEQKRMQPIPILATSLRPVSSSRLSGTIFCQGSAMEKLSRAIHRVSGLSAHPEHGLRKNNRAENSYRAIHRRRQSVAAISIASVSVP